MANEKFWLIFPDQPSVKYEIDEPINYRQIDFDLDRKENGHALDVSFSGGKVNFRFTDKRNHYLDKILYWNHYKGFEASVLLGFKLETGEEFLGEFDFYTATTNDYNYFECSIIVQSEMQIFKRRSETKVDLFSNRDINGNQITPLQPINMLLQAKPTVQETRWKQFSPITIKNPPLLASYVSVTQSFDKTSDIQDSFVPLSQYSGSINDFKVVKAENKLINLNINLSNIDIKINGAHNVALILLKGETIPNVLGNSFPIPQLNQKDGHIFYQNSGNSTSIPVSFPEYEIGNLERGESLWLFLKVSLSNPEIIVNTINVSISVESVAYNSVFPTFRLIDVMKQVSKSISGLGVYAPRYEANGEFYDTVLTNGNLLRNIQNKPFYISWEDIEKSIIGEHNADAEIRQDKLVFVGIEKDFYTNHECYFFDNTQFSGMSKKQNPEYALNKFSLKYSKYQSLKEQTEPNSESTIHGESQLTPYNQKAENSKEVSIEWVRDAILLDVQQRLSTKVSTDTATQEDDTIFAIDTVFTTEDQNFTENTNLQHTYLGGNNLSLRNNGEIDFIILGIRVGTVFIILAPDPNNGNYNVSEISSTELKLSKTSPGGISGGNDGVRLNKYVYEIKQFTTPLTNRTSQGFSLILNLSTPNKYSNLRYSVERNIRNYWGSFLATVNIYWNDKPIKNTYYKNNSKCETEYNGLRIIEKEDFIPTDPIVTPVMYEDVIFASVEHSEYLYLQGMLRNTHGFIRTIDNNRRVLKLYVLKMSYEVESKQLTIVGKEKFEKSYLEIVKNGSTVIINDETYVISLKYEVDEGNKIILLDSENERLYNGVYWDKVTVNGAIAPTLNVLKGWLDLLE